MAQILETERLVLRDLCEEDWESYVAAFKDPLVQEGILEFQSQDEQIERHFENSLRLAQQTTRISYAPAIVLKRHNFLIGTCSLSQAFPHSFQCRMGWHLVNSYKGQVLLLMEEPSQCGGDAARRISLAALQSAAAFQPHFEALL